MVKTLSTMMPLGTKAPDFKLTDVVSEKTIDLGTFSNKKGLLIMFICKHCPFVVHVQKELANIGRDYQAKDLGVLAISSNDVENYPDDSPENLKAMAKELEFSFPYCYDETQSVAQSYKAACTPDFFLFNKNQELVYRGQLDDSRPSNGLPVTGRDLRTAIESVLQNQTIKIEQKPSIGCNIKWKQGNEPDYFK